MPGPEMDLKRELIEAGNRLLRPPDHVDDLLALLDRVEHCLSSVEQQPAVVVQDALCPIFKALITNELLKHPDTDVRVGVTLCLTEISRITAPDVPYNDDLMKELFKLTISAFEGLSDNSSKSFSKRVSILEIVARVRSCAVLLDLDCNDLVVEMFQIFYKCIRDFHTSIVFASMESIMTLIIEESEEISTDILLALLSVLRKDNKDVLPIARKLGEKVVHSCAPILKPCIVDAITSLKVNLLDYAYVVTMACQVTQNHNPLKDNVVNVPLVNGGESAAFVEDVAQAVTASNGNTEAVENVTMEMLNASSKQDSTVVVRTAETIQDQVQSVQDTPAPDTAMNSEPVSSSKSEPKSEKVAKKRGRKPKGAKEIKMQTDRGKSPKPDSNKESSVVNIHTESCKAPPEESSLEPNIVAKKSDSSSKRLSPKAVADNVITLGSTSQSKSLPGKSSSKRNRKSKKAMSTHEKIPPSQSYQITEIDTPDGLDDTETRLVHLEKGAPDGAMDAASVSLVEVKKELDNEGESEDTPVKQSSLKLGVTDGTPRTKKRGRPRKDASISAATGVKDRVSSEGNSEKRPRQTPAADGKVYGEELVGASIKVWWPQDKTYYAGIVESFDPVKRKHKVLYTDNEREVLNLHKQKWKFMESSVGTEKNGEASHTNAGESSDIQQNKKLKLDSDSVGKTGNTGSPPKRRGRPPKSATALASPASAGKSKTLDGEMTDSKADAGNPAKSLESPSKSLPNLNDLFEDSAQEQEVPGNDGTKATKDLTNGAGVTETVVSKEATVAMGIDINETFALGSDENPNLVETATPKCGPSDVNVSKDVESVPSGGSKTKGLNKEIPASDTAKKPRKRKTRTNSNSSSLTVPGSSDTSVKRRRGRPSMLSLGTFDEKSVIKKQLGDPQVDELKSGSHSDNLVVVNSEDSLAEGSKTPNMNATLKVSEHVVVDKNVTESTDSVIIGTKVDVALEQISSKSASGEPKSSSSTRLKLKLKTSDAEPKLQSKKARKNTSSSPEQVKKDGSVKRPRGRPCKPKIGDPGNGSGSSLIFKNDIPNVCNVLKDSEAVNVQESSVPADAVDLTLGLATESKKGDDGSEKSPASEASKGNLTTSSSSKEQQSESTAVHEGDGKLRNKMSKESGGELFS